MVTIKENFTIAPLTSFKIGGPVKYFAKISDPKDLPEIFSKIKASGLPYVIMGGSSNMLFPTAGFSGWVIKLEFQELEKETAEDILKVGAGVPLSSLIQTTVQLGLGGLHKLTGIPGTVGGAIRGNAGANGVEISQFLETIEIFDIKNQTFKTLSPKDCAFNYRESLFVKNPELLILGATFKLPSKDRAVIKEETSTILLTRRKRPYTRYPSAGSVFKNIDLNLIQDEGVKNKLIKAYKKKQEENLAAPQPPIDYKNLESIPAGFVLEAVGLRGLEEGGAQISTEHANIIVNKGAATSNDVLSLIQTMQEKVKKEWGVDLQKEVVVVETLNPASSPAPASVSTPQN